MAYKKFPVPRFTQTPNIVFDEYLAILGYAELKILLAVCRQTYGWHKSKKRISISHFMKTTGLSNRAVIDATRKLIGRDMMERHACVEGFEYSLIIDASEVTSLPPCEVTSHIKERQTKERTKGDLIDGMVALSKAPIPFDDYPVDVADKLRIIMKHFPHLKVVNKSDWIKQVREYLPMNESDIEKMCVYAKDNKWKVARPRSISSAYNMMSHDTEKEDEWEPL